MKLTLFISFLLLGWTSFSQKDAEIYEKAIIEADSENYKKALKLVNKAIKINPMNTDYLVFQGDVLFELRDPAAFNSYSDAIFFEPENPNLYNSRGSYLTQIGSFKKAIKDFSKAITYAESDSAKCLYYSNRSTAKSFGRNHDGAYEDLMKAYQLDSNNVSVLINLGAVCDEVGRGDETIYYLNRVLEIEPDNAGAYVNLGFKYQKMENYEESIAYFDKAIELNPESALAYSNNSFNKLQIGDTDGALKDINRSLELYPSNSWAYKNRALIYIELRDYENACADLQIAIEYGFTKMYGNEVIELQKKYCR